MTTIRILTIATLTGALTLGHTAFAGTHSASQAGSTASKPAASKGVKSGTVTIVGIVLANDGEFDVLQAAVIRAGLVDVLNGKRQYTVFAPTDAAFMKTLGVSTEEEAMDVVKALPLDTLKHILLYHLTEGRRNSTSVLAAPRYKMLNGQHLTRAELADAGVAATDISAANGIIHVINSVLIP